MHWTLPAGPGRRGQAGSTSSPQEASRPEKRASSPTPGTTTRDPSSCPVPPCQPRRRGSARRPQNPAFPWRRPGQGLSLPTFLLLPGDGRTPGLPAALPDGDKTGSHDSAGGGGVGFSLQRAPPHACDILSMPASEQVPVALEEGGVPRRGQQIHLLGTDTKAGLPGAGAPCVKASHRHPEEDCRSALDTPADEQQWGDTPSTPGKNGLFARWAEEDSTRRKPAPCPAPAW